MMDRSGMNQRQNTQHNLMTIRNQIWANWTNLYEFVQSQSYAFIRSA